MKKETEESLIKWLEISPKNEICMPNVKDVNEVCLSLKNTNLDVYTSKDDFLKAYTNGGVFVVDLKRCTDVDVIADAMEYYLVTVSEHYNKDSIKYTRNEKFSIIFINEDLQELDRNYNGRHSLDNLWLLHSTCIL